MLSSALSMSQSQMQQTDNNHLLTPQDVLTARRLAESNATTNHFLGATPRPWMTNAVIIPSLPAERAMLSSQPIRGNMFSNNILVRAPGEHTEQGARTTAQAQSSEISQPSAGEGSSVIAGRMTGGERTDDTARKRSHDAAESEVNIRRHNTMQQTQRPGLVPPVPSSEAVQATVSLGDLSLSATHRAQSMIDSALRCLDSFQAKLEGSSSIEIPRVLLLKDACLQNDLFYLYMHQLFCAASDDPRRIAETGFDAEQHAGLVHLGLILCHNRDLSTKVLSFFADFPAPLTVLFKEPVLYMSVVEQVGVFLRLFAGGWDLLREKCFARKSPPFVAELVGTFGVHSPILQKVLFNSIHRQLGGTDDTSWSEQGLRLFDSNQAQYQSWQRSRGNTEVRLESIIQAEQMNFGAMYVGLWKEAHDSTYQRAPEHDVFTPILTTHSITQQPAYGTSHSQNVSTPVTCTSTPHQQFDRLQSSTAQNALSRSRSAGTLRINTEVASDSLTGARSASRTQNFPTSVSSPNLMQQTHYTGGLGNFPNTRSPQSHAGQEPPPRRRRGRPPLSNRPVVPHIPTTVTLRGGRGGRGGHGSRGGRGGRGGLTGTHSPADQATSNLTTLIPPLGYEPIQMSNPNPSRVALHQAYLRSPAVEKVNAVGQRVNDIRLYQYLCAFAIPPRAIDYGNPFICWEFVVTPSGIDKKPEVIVGSDGQPRRLLSDGCILYRLRSVEVPPSLQAIGQGDWNVREVSWPSSCFVRINEVDIELRRKLHHGKDLPVDVTPHIREGRNSITIATLHSKEEKTPKRYAMAVEVLEVGDQVRVDSAPTMISANDSLRSITQGLATSHASQAGNDDEVQVIDSHISIDLTDPFMATLFEVPARGISCNHRECFDLQTFFQTRKSRVKGGPTSPDEWKCPICKKDARPAALVVDGFLKTIRDSLVATGAAADARAILIASDGSWTVKKEGGDAIRTGRDSSSATVAGSPAVRSTTRGSASRSVSAVIEIDGD